MLWPIVLGLTFGVFLWRYLYSTGTHYFYEIFSSIKDPKKIKRAKISDAATATIRTLFAMMFSTAIGAFIAFWIGSYLPKQFTKHIATIKLASIGGDEKTGACFLAVEENKNYKNELSFFYRPKNFPLWKIEKMTTAKELVLVNESDTNKNTLEIKKAASTKRWHRWIALEGNVQQFNFFITPNSLCR